MLSDINKAGWVKVVFYGLLLIITYYSTLKWLILHDWAVEDYSYCYLIPLVVLYLIWEKRAALASLPSLPSWKGLIPFGLGLAFFWLGELGGEFFTLYISLWLVITGLSLLHLGWVKIKVIWFALIMMLAMFPFPNFVNVRISLYLKLISSQIGVWILHILGMSAYREGNIIDLGFTQLQVVDACSGLRYLIPLMILSLILAHWFKTRFWKRAVLFLSSIPIAIFVNSFRIALTGVIHSIWGSDVAEGFFHGFSGWLIFIFTLAVLLAEMWLLRRIAKEPVIAADQVRCENNSEKSPVSLVAKKRNKATWNQPQFIVASVLLLLSMGFTQGIEFREKIPIARPLNQLPLQIGEWKGNAELLEPQYIESLHFTDYTIVNYRDRKDHYVNFYTAYYESQRKGESIHSPETCLPSGGWEFKEAGNVTLLLPGGRTMLVNRAFIEKNGESQLTYYWFAQRGRILTNLYQLKIYAFWDALIRKRTDGALIRMITPLYPDEALSDAEARLKRFTLVIEPVLREFIPQ